MSEPNQTRPASALVVPDGWAPRFYEERDAEAVVAVLTAAFDGWPTVEISVPAIDHYRWKIAGHPEAAQLGLVAEFDGRIVGSQDYFLMRMKAGDDELLAKQGVDFCVHPDYQRLGIRTRLRVMAKDNPRRNYQAYFSCPGGHPANRRIERRIGKRKSKEGRLANQVELWVRDAAARREHPQEIHDWTVRRVAQFDERIDAFWEVASRPFELIIVRRREYLNWRFADERGGRFAIHVAEQGDALLGYIVVRISHGRGYIADILTLPDRNDVVSSLVADGLAWLDANGASAVECWLPGRHPYWAAIREHGFSHKRKNAKFSVRPALEYESQYQMPFVHDPQAALHITIGDSDLV